MKPQKHKSFMLSHSPVKRPVANALISVILLGIVTVNVAILLNANEVLQTCVF